MNGQIILCTLVLLVAAVSARGPFPARTNTYAKYKDKFYVYGGIKYLKTPYGPIHSTNFFELDLAKPWSLGSAAWTNLTDGLNSDSNGAFVSWDGKKFISFGVFDLPSQQYSFETGTWSPLYLPFRAGDGAPVVLGTDGTILTVSGDNYVIYSLDTGQVISTALPPYNADVTPYLPARGNYRAVWSDYLQSAVVFGGPPLERAFPTDQWVSLYHPQTNKWTSMKTFGLKIEGIVDNCLAITDDGKRLFSYGGKITLMPNTHVNSDLFMLNLETGEWFECAKSEIIRSNAACTISGDYFFLWGGTVNYRDIVDVIGVVHGPNPTALFQISKNAWVDEYQPFTEYRDPFPSSPRPPSTSPPPQGSNNTSDESQSLKESTGVGYIAGAVAGALAVIVVVGFLVWKRKRQRTNQSRQQDDTISEDSHHTYSLEDKSNFYNGTKRSPQSHVQLTSPRSMQCSDDTIYGGGDQDEYWDIPKRSGIDLVTRGTPRTKPMSGKTPVHSPLSDSWNVDSNGGHTEDRMWANPGASSTRTQIDSSRSHMSPRLKDMFVSPPPPSLSPLSDPPVISRLRSPQELEYRPEWRERLDQSQGGDGKWVEEQRGPQWLPR